jgi:hypothetical protein
VQKLSIYEDCVRVVRIHKWIESEKAGRDLGEEAVRCWIKKHWNGYLRSRWLEHLQGIRHWIELDQDDFGLLLTHFGQLPLVAEIVEQLKNRGENLSIFVWGHKTGQDMEMVIKVLEVLKVNSRRIECTLDINLCMG